MKYNTIIIGGGLAGLTAGATLSKFGKKVLLLEQHHKPGGCATTFKRGDFIVEVGLHEMSGLFEGGSIPQIFNLLDVTKHIDFLKVPEFYAVVSGDKTFVCPHGFDNAINAFTDKYPEEEKGIRKFFKVIQSIRKEATSLPRSPLKQKLIYPLMSLLYPNLFQATKHTIGSWLDKHITNEDLKLDLTAHLVYWSDDPYKLSLFYFGLPFSGFIKNGGHFIKGGSQQLSSYLAEYIEKHDGTVLLGKKAEKIITKNGKVTGVRFTDSFNKHLEPVTITCDNVIANCAIPIVPELLDEPHASLLREKIANHTDSCSLLCMYLGFKTELEKFGVNHYSNFVRGEDVKSLKDLLPNNKGDWSTRSFIFVDYNKVNSGLAPKGKSEGVICAADYLDQWENLSEDDYKIKKEQVAKTLLMRLDKQFPGIRESIEYYEVSTPKTVKRFTSNPSGSVYGYAQSKEQTAGKRFRNNFLIPNLYFASAWGFPGGGFEGSITGGFLAALQMNKDHIWSQPETGSYTDKRVVKLSKSKVTDDNNLELQFEKPKYLDYKKGQYAILNLKNPKETELDLPYRWLPLNFNGDDKTLTFKVELDGSSFSKSCAIMEEGEEALIFGPM